MTDVEQIAKSLTKAQRDVVLAIRPGEERRAIDFKGSVAKRLRWGTGKRPPLVTVQITVSSEIAKRIDDSSSSPARSACEPEWTRIPWVETDMGGGAGGRFGKVEWTKTAEAVPAKRAGHPVEDRPALLGVLWGR